MENVPSRQESHSEFLRVEHLGIAVHSLEEAEPLYTRLLGVPPYKRETVETEGVVTSFFGWGPTKLSCCKASIPMALSPNSWPKGAKDFTMLPMPWRISGPRWPGSARKVFNCYRRNPGKEQTISGFVFASTQCGGMLVELCQHRRHDEQSG